MDSPYRYDDDGDLSTLTNIRINNRKAKQKLLNKALADTTNYDFNITSSPLKQTYSPTKRSTRQTKSSEGKYSSYRDIDSTYRKEDERLLDNDLYTLDKHLNDLKRNRFLNNIKSPGASSPFNSNRSRRSERTNIKENVIYPLNNDLDDTFKYKRGHIRHDSIPNLKPKSPSRFSSPTIRRKYNDDELFSNFRKLNLRDDVEHKNYNDEVDKILYGNNESEDRDVQTTSKEMEIKELQSKLHRLEYELETYKRAAKSSNDDMVHVKNQYTLKKEISDLNKFIGFLESNFDKVYQNSAKLKKEKQQLYSTNQELISENKRYKEMLAKYETSVNQPKDNDESTTYHLMKFDINDHHASP